MQRRVDQTDYSNLMRAKDIIDAAFSSDGTDWFQAEQMDLHDASSAMSRLLNSLQQETLIRAIASRIVTAAWQDRLPKGMPESIRHITDWGRAKKLVESCSTCGCGFSAPMSLDGFQEGDRVRRRSDGMEGAVDYVGSGPKGDSLSVLWDNPTEQIMGPDIVKPSAVEKM